MNERFTALAIGRLAERGELAYSDPLSKWGGRRGGRQKIRELLAARKAAR